MPTLKDERCQRLLVNSDLRTLAAVHERWPDLCPEWPFLAFLNRPVLDAATYAEKCATEPMWCDGRDIARVLTDELAWLHDTPRLELLMRWLGECRDASHVVDVGAWIGAWSVYMANHAVVTVDSIEAVASAWAFYEAMVASHAAHPATLHLNRGLLSEVSATIRGADFVWAGEILEHQWDWRGFLSDLEAMCSPGAMVCLSTPYGPWESADPTTNRGHVAHWETPDLQAILAGRRAELVQMVGRDGQGVHMWRFAAEPGKPWPAFPIEQKLARHGFGV